MTNQDAFVNYRGMKIKHSGSPRFRVNLFSEDAQLFCYLQQDVVHLLVCGEYSSSVSFDGTAALLNNLIIKQSYSIIYKE